MALTQGMIALRRELAAKKFGSLRRSLGRARLLGPSAALNGHGALPVILGELALAFLLFCTPAALLAQSNTPSREPASASTQDSDSPIELINERLRFYWEKHKILPSPAATDGEWCRRVFLDVLGRIPTIEELERFLSEPARERKTRLADRLLGSDYVDEYARNWSTLWTNVLIGRSGGTERNSLVNRPGLEQALRRAFRGNLPYDRLAMELISAKGVNKPGEDGFNGFVNFMVGNLEEKGVQATAKTSQVFLGLQIQCTQCHNHPFNDWKQSQFWELNAFFRQTRALRRFDRGASRQIASVELINQDFAGEDNMPEKAASFYEQRNGLVKVAYPAFVDGTRLKTDSGFVEEVDRRTELAKLIVNSDFLGKALVNRMWAHFLGYGFTRPVDDMGPHNPPSHPELLDALAGEFTSRGYNPKSLIRWIVLSQPYGLSSKIIARNKKDSPQQGEKPLFSRFYMRQMRPEEMYQSLLVATEVDQAGKDAESLEAARSEWLKQFALSYGNDDKEEGTTFNGTIPQTLMMMNGELISKATSSQKDGRLHRMANDSSLTNAVRIQRLYLAALARKPTAQEIVLANDLLALRQDPAKALEDVWWAILNSGEFILNH
jgi:hypothetical protein